MRTNNANSLVWLGGAHAFNSLLFLPLRDAMAKLPPSVSTHLWLLLCCWVATAWQALDLIGMRLFLLDRFLTAIYLRPYAPAFVAGVLLASLHALLANTQHLKHWQSGCSLLALITLPVVIYVHVYIPQHTWWGVYLRGWVETGLYLPVICVLVFGAARPRLVDPVSWIFGTLLRPLGAVAPYCLDMLFVEQPLYLISALFFSFNMPKNLISASVAPYPPHCYNGKTDDGSPEGFDYRPTALSPSVFVDYKETGIDMGGDCWPNFPESRVEAQALACWFGLLVASLLLVVLSRRLWQPLVRAVRCFLPPDGFAVHTTYLESGRTPEEYAGVRLLLYYGAFVTAVATFCLAQEFDPWVNIVDVTEVGAELGEVGAFANFLSYFSWVLLLPAPCLLQSLLGFLFYPAVTEVQRKSESIEQQLRDEAASRPQVLSSRPLFRMPLRAATTLSCCQLKQGDTN